MSKRISFSERSGLRVIHIEAVGAGTWEVAEAIALAHRIAAELVIKYGTTYHHRVATTDVGARILTSLSQVCVTHVFTMHLAIMRLTVDARAKVEWPSNVKATPSARIPARNLNMKHRQAIPTCKCPLSGLHTADGEPTRTHSEPCPEVV